MIFVGQEEGYDFTYDDPEGIQTDSLATCIGIAILNVTKGWAGLLHAPGLTHNEGLYGFLSEAADASDPQDQIQIWVGGGDNTDRARGLVPRWMKIESA
jgi:hypothetical protein